jgi:membrane protein involved in colicin uptake
LKREAIELREKLRQAKASLADYEARKAQQQKALADGQKTLAALKARAKATPAAAPAKPSAKAKPAPEPERERLHREMQAITDPEKRRTFRLRNWNKLSKQFTAPTPRKA